MLVVRQRRVNSSPGWTRACGRGSLIGMTSPETFRAEIRAWLEANTPPSMRTPMPDTETPWGGRHGKWPNPESKQWLDRMAAKGWTVPTWPVEYGGAGLSEADARILADELRRVAARPAHLNFGIWMLGPVLQHYATDEQKCRFLPSIARGEIRWCQGYSEPGAGSDLASLRTRCEDIGDHWLVNGQKVWTSYADEADWMFCLVRTDPNAPKHEGISFILFDMATPGVETRPIPLISGASPFCETFLTDVRVPKNQMVGAPGAGWEIAKALLAHERANISAEGFARGDGIGLVEAAREGVGEVDGRIADPHVRQRVAAQSMAQRSFELTLQRLRQERAPYRADALASMAKVAAAELNKARLELTVEALGYDGLGWDGPGFAPAHLKATRAMLRSKGNSIEGGTSEINLNVLAKRGLGLRDHQ